MVSSAGQPAVKTSLLAIAILAGMATTAAIFLLLALYPGNVSHAPAANGSVQSGRPSPFAAGTISAAPSEANLPPARIAKAGNQAVVVVTGYDSNDQPLSQANGFVYSASGIVVTSYSAIRGASSVAINVPNGQELNVIALMGYSPNQDLAVLAVLEGNLPALETGASEVAQEGDPVMAIGPNRAVSQGTIGPRRSFSGVDLIQINAPAAPGSPVLNLHGKVIGVIVNRSAGGHAVYAVPSHDISDLLAEHRSISFAQMLEETAKPTP